MEQSTCNVEFTEKLDGTKKILASACRSHNKPLWRMLTLLSASAKSPVHLTSKQQDKVMTNNITLNSVVTPHCKMIKTKTPQHSVTKIIVHSTKLLDSDWTRGVQLIPNCTL